MLLQSFFIKTNGLLLLLLLADASMQNCKAATADKTGSPHSASHSTIELEEIHEIQSVISSLGELRLGSSSTGTVGLDCPSHRTVGSEETHEIKAGTFHDVIYFYTSRLCSLSAIDQSDSGIILNHRDGNSKLILDPDYRPRYGMDCYHKSLGFGIIYSLEMIRMRADRDDAWDEDPFRARWAGERPPGTSITQRIAYSTFDKDNKSLVFVFFNQDWRLAE